jgi:hypothetical protein
MTTRSGSSHLNHLFQVGILIERTGKPYPNAVRVEAQAELRRYRDEGLIIQKERDRMAEGSRIPMTMSGGCAFEHAGSHASCNKLDCTCECHDEPKNFSGKGIIFAVIDDREKVRPGKVTTIDVIADAIEAALDAGKETSDEIARYLTTSAFSHIKDKRVRFNSVLKAGDTVGAKIVKKLFNAYEELCETAEDEKDPEQQATLEAEARGFAEALQIVMNPFACEDEEDPTLVSWDEVDRLTELFETDRRQARDFRKTGKLTTGEKK